MNLKKRPLLLQVEVHYVGYCICLGCYPAKKEQWGINVNVIKTCYNKKLRYTCDSIAN